MNSAIDDDLAYEVGVGVGTDIANLRSESAILVLGTDLDEEVPMLYIKARTAGRKGANLITAGGRSTKLDAVAKQALLYQYGTAPQFVLSLIKVILDEGLENKDFISAHVDGVAELKTKLNDYTPAKVAKLTGLAANDIITAARTFAQAENGIILYGAEAGNDPALASALKALALLTGHAGKANNGVTAILPHTNSRGAADLGIVPHRLPGYKVLEETQAGLSASEMLSADSALKALYIVAADVVAESTAYKAAVEATEFVVVQDLFMTETAKLADVILPAKGTAERDGSFTNIERRVQAFDIAVPAPGNTWADWLITTAIAGQLGAEWSYASADGVMAAITQEVPLYAQMSFSNLLQPISLERKRSHYIYSGMSFTSTIREGLQWPSEAENDGAKLSVDFVAPATPTKNADLIMWVGAPRVLYDGGILLAQTDLLSSHIHQPVLSIGSQTASELSLNKDELVALKPTKAKLV